MPQTNYYPLYQASYPLLAKVQKPGGVTVVTTVAAGDVPNKPTYLAGTIQLASVEPEAKVEDQAEVEEEHTEEERHTRGGRSKSRRR